MFFTLLHNPVDEVAKLFIVSVLSKVDTIKCNYIFSVQTHFLSK